MKINFQVEDVSKSVEKTNEKEKSNEKNNFTLELKETTTVRQCKELVSQQTKIEVRNIILIYGEIIMNDDTKTLQDYKLVDNCTIVVQNDKIKQRAMNVDLELACDENIGLNEEYDQHEKVNIGEKELECSSTSNKQSFFGGGGGHIMNNWSHENRPFRNQQQSNFRNQQQQQQQQQQSNFRSFSFDPSTDSIFPQTAAAGAVATAGAASFFSLSTHDFPNNNINNNNNNNKNQSVADGQSKDTDYFSTCHSGVKVCGVQDTDKTDPRTTHINGLIFTVKCKTCLEKVNISMQHGTFYLFMDEKEKHKSTKVFCPLCEESVVPQIPSFCRCWYIIQTTHFNGFIETIPWKSVRDELFEYSDTKSAVLPGVKTNNGSALTKVKSVKIETKPLQFFVYMNPIVETFTDPSEEDFKLSQVFTNYKLDNDLPTPKIPDGAPILLRIQRERNESKNKKESNESKKEKEQEKENNKNQKEKQEKDGLMTKMVEQNKIMTVSRAEDIKKYCGDQCEFVGSNKLITIVQNSNLVYYLTNNFNLSLNASTIFNSNSNSNSRLDGESFEYEYEIMFARVEKETTLIKDFKVLETSVGAQMLKEISADLLKSAKNWHKFDFTNGVGFAIDVTNIEKHTDAATLNKFIKNNLARVLIYDSQAQQNPTSSSIKKSSVKYLSARIVSNDEYNQYHNGSWKHLIESWNKNYSFFFNIF